MQEDAQSSPVRGAMVPGRNDLLVNQSKKDGCSPKKELLSQLKKRVKRRKTSNVEGYRLLNTTIFRAPW